MKLVLVVDDEAALLELFAGVISDLGHRVVTAHDGIEALALARTHQPDLIVSDHMMPGLSGMELLQRIREDAALANTPFVLVTAAQVKGAEAATVHLSKPVPLEDLERAISAVLSQSKDDRDRSSLATVTTPAVGGEMLAWMAHEVKTPLSAARINVELMRRQLAGNETLIRRCDTIVVQLDRMNHLVNSVLDAARLSEGRVQLEARPTDLVALLKDVVRTWSEARPGSKFELSAPMPELEVSLDPERIRLVLDNLLSNAVKYGGAEPIRVSLEPSAGRVHVIVTDRGPGIDAAELPHLFDRFHRAVGSKGEGHGLGLYIAAASARLHGGSLTVKSEHGVGTTFTLTLPVMR